MSHTRKITYDSTSWPRSFLIEGFAPYCNNNSTISMSPRFAAWCRAVEPHISAIFRTTFDRVIFKRTASANAASTIFPSIVFGVILSCMFTPHSSRYRTTFGSQSSLLQARIKADVPLLLEIRILACLSCTCDKVLEVLFVKDTYTAQHTRYFTRSSFLGPM